MDYLKFLERVVNEGIEAAKADYTKPQQKSKLEGSIEGFEACRGKSPEEILKLLTDARLKTLQAFHDVHDEKVESDEYWKIRCRESEIEWTANCVSAVLANQGLPTIVPPTARGTLKAAEIVGVKES